MYLARQGVGVLLMLLYTHVLLSISGYVTPPGVTWRIIQSLVTLAYFCWRLYRFAEVHFLLSHLRMTICILRLNNFCVF